MTGFNFLSYWLVYRYILSNSSHWSIENVKLMHSCLRFWHTEVDISNDYISNYFLTIEMWPSLSLEFIMKLLNVLGFNKINEGIPHITSILN